MARSFNGSTDKAIRGFGGLSAPFTFAAWVKWTSGSGTVISDAASSSSNRRWNLYITSGGVVQFESKQATSSFASASGVVTPGVWTHVMATVGAGAAVYRDGANKGTGGVTTPLGTGTLGVGVCNNLTPFNFFNGVIAYPTIWLDTLSDADAAMLAARAIPTTIATGSLYSAWPFAGASPEPDVIGGRDLTLTGTTYVSDSPFSGGNSRYYQQQQAAVVA